MSSLFKELFSGLLEGALRSKEVASLWVLATLEGLGIGALIGVTKRVLLSAFTCILAIGGAIAGAIHGAIKGQTTETGFSIGAGIGGLAGAIAAIQLMDLIVDGQPLSKVALLGGMVNGKVFTEWMSSALLKAYHWQVSTLETYREISELYDITRVKGLSQDCIQNLPQSMFCSSNIIESSDEFCCSICLQELEDGDYTRELPICRHLFHLACIDLWLRRQGSCPMCRVHVSDGQDHERK
ncbi:putative transcription factor C2H2 family [Rosa chinensis]|uniref:Putative transcription factor C2H2 family n=1 Tax=Rosa chinensis TaxID=74649 RepID=A0A2P6QCA5_ROSCH|nr:NEP1-interacting protein-like 2 isoform X2 [Rosa chinensis]PRQ31817.1 putative transcription factor C2H2 family [Rosa chinensis]